MTTNQTERVSDEELDQMIWKLERDGMTPKMLSLMRELREVRRAKVEPVAYLFPESNKESAQVGFPYELDDEQKDNCLPLYTVPPSPVAPDTFMPKNLDRALGVVGVALPESKEEFNFQLERWTQRLIDRVIRYADEFQTPPAPVVPDVIATDDIPYSVGRFRTHRDCYRDGWNACRAAMLNHSGDTADMVEPVSNRDELPATQFKPVADLYGITSPTGSETSFTFDAIEAANFVEGGWSVQEYVELERYQEAMIGNSPATPDGWQLVPVEPTHEMRDAYHNAQEEYESVDGLWSPDHQWKAMITAAPKEVG